MVIDGTGIVPFVTGNGSSVWTLKEGDTEGKRERGTGPEGTTRVRYQ